MEGTVYLQWDAPAYLHKKRDRQFFQNIAAIVLLLLVILFFAGEFMLILAVVSVFFIVYVFSTVEPQTVTHSIVSKGIYSSGQLYSWDHLKDFWFDEQWGKRILVLRTIQDVRLSLLLGSTPVSKVEEILQRFIVHNEEIQPTFVDSAAKWISKKIPVDSSS